MPFCRQGIGDVFGQIDQDRTGATFARDEIGLCHHAGNVGGVARDVAVFDNRQGDAENIDFLKRVRPYEVCRHLTRDKNNRNGIEISFGNRGDEIGRAGARRCKGRTGTACGAGIANRGHAATLFVTTQNVTQLRHTREHIIDGHNRAAGISENRFHAFRGNGFKQKLRAGFRLAVFENFGSLCVKLHGCGHYFYPITFLPRLRGRWAANAARRGEQQKAEVSVFRSPHPRFAGLPP